MYEGQLIERAARAWTRGWGDQPCRDRSTASKHTNGVLVTLINVNGILAHYFYWPKSDRMRRVYITSPALEVVGG